MGSSKVIPAHSPGANCVSPIYDILPPFVPPTQTRSPMIKLSVSSVKITDASVACRLTFAGCVCDLGACMPEELLAISPVLGLFKLPIFYIRAQSTL